MDGFRTSPLMKAAPGDNRYAGAGLEVLEGDMLGFSIDDKAYWQIPSPGYSMQAEIDREGTFTRVT